MADESTPAATTATADAPGSAPAPPPAAAAPTSAPPAATTAAADPAKDPAAAAAGSDASALPAGDGRANPAPGGSGAATTAPTDPNAATPDAAAPEGGTEDGDEPAFRIHLADDVPDKLKDYAYVGSDGKTAYRTWEDAARGIEHKDKVIQSARAEAEALRAEAAALGQRLALFEATTTDDEARAALVQQHLPEGFRGKTEDDIVDSAELRAYHRALDEAEAEADRVLDERVNGPARRQAEEAQRQAERIGAAQAYVGGLATADFFGVNSLRGDDPDFADALRDLSRTVTGENGKEHVVTPIETAQAVHVMLSAEYSPEVAEAAAALVLGGLKAAVAERRQKGVEAIRERVMRRQHTAGTSVQTPAATPAPPPAPEKPGSALERIRRAREASEAKRV